MPIFISLDNKVIEKTLTDYRLKAQEMNVGVNYMALDEERRRQELLLRELREIEEEIASPNLRGSKLPSLASVVGTELSHNSKCLQYLAGISELERSIGDMTTHFTERSVELSDPNALSKDVVTFKTLTENVKSCWSYVDQLATLAQIHLKASSEYHQFFHEANEIEAKLEKQLADAQKALKSATERRSHKEATKMATEINEQLNVMRSLWQRSMKLVKRSEMIVPIRLRMGGVSKGMAIGDPSNRPVMVRALVSLTGPDYKIQKGEILRLMDNHQDSHLWRVRTSTGTVEVPGVCLWLMNSDTEAIDQAIGIKQRCKKTWLEIINLIRLRLYEVYFDLLEQFNSQEVICSHEEALNLLFDDLKNLLITPVGQDGRLKSNLDTFRRRVIITKRLERLQSGDINLRESDIVQIRSPLLRLHDHIIAANQMQQDMKRLNDHITEYLSQVEDDQKQIENNLEQLNRMTRMSEQQLKDMMRKLDKMRDKSLYTQPTARLKVEPLFEAQERLPKQKRSRSQPRMSVLNAVSSSSSSDSETSANLYVRNGLGRRAKSHIGQRDAVVQIGYKSKNAEAQNLNGKSDAPRAYSQSDKSVQLVPAAPLQRSAQTQIGYSVNTGGVQVDASSMEAYNMELKRNRRSRSMTSSSEEDEPQDYISQVPTGGLQIVEKTKRKHRTRKSPSDVILVHSSTQLGIATNDKALSPVREIDRPQACPTCQRRSLMVSQTQIGPLYSGSERYQDYPLHDVKSEKGPHHRINKKVQSGYPCLTDRANLYCQCDVLGPERMIEEMETESVIYQTPLSTDKRKKMDTYAQVGVLYSNARQQAQPLLTDTISSSTQVGMLYEGPQRRTGHAQVQQRSLTDLSSAETMTETVPIEKDRYVTAVSMKPNASSSATQIGTLLMGTSVQMQGVEKGCSDSNVQVGKIYLQKEYAGLNVENNVEQVVPNVQQAEYASSPRKLPTGMSVQVMREQCDTTTQISGLLTHNEVQTCETNLRTHDLQVYNADIHKPKRASSVPSVQYSSETQIGPMVMHESLSPIGDYMKTAKATEVLSVQAVPKSTKHKRIQSCGVPSSRNVEIQIGQLLQESATQSIVESYDNTHISPTLLAVQQKAISLPNVGVAEAQVQPDVRGKKLQVSIAMGEPSAGKKNKKLQVSVDTLKQMYDVQVETLPMEQKEHFDVSCDTQILPSKVPKKVQVSLMDLSGIPMISNEQPVYSMPPTNIDKLESAPGVAVYSVPPIGVSDTACEPISSTQYYDAQCQCQNLIQTPPPVKVEMADSANDPINIIRTVGKKLQVEIGKPVVETPPVPKTTVDTMCEAMASRDMYDASLQVAIIEKQPLIELERSQIPVFSAPPLKAATPPKTECCDTGNDPIGITQAYDSFTQSEKVTGIGKKLQVAIEFEQPHYEITTQQTYFDDTISVQQPAIMQPVYSAPPQPKLETEDRACEPTPPSMAFDASVQVAEVEKPTRNIVGKKLQVSLPGFDKSAQTEEVEKPKVAAMGKKLQVTPPALSLESTQTIFIEPEVLYVEQESKEYSAPPVMTPPKVQTDDRACDALEMLQVFDAGVQVVSIQDQPRPTVVDKKLQVNSEPLAIMSSLGDCRQIPVLEVSVIQSSQAPVEPQPIQVQAMAREYAAPPPTVQKEDRACDAVKRIDNFDASVQAVGAGEPKPMMIGKMLQISPTPLDTVNVQTVYEELPPQVIQIEQLNKEFAAPPAKPQVYDAATQAIEEKPHLILRVQKMQTSLPTTKMIDQSANALEQALSFDVSVQVADAPKPTIKSKNLQVSSSSFTSVKPQLDDKILQISPVPLEDTLIQSTLAPLKETVVASAPKVQTFNKECEAAMKVPSFDAEVQFSEVVPVLGKKLQVSLPLLETTMIQSDFPVEVKTPVVPVEKAPVVFAAPPTPIKIITTDSSCDPIQASQTFDAITQSSPVTFAEAVAKPQMIGKKLQVDLIPNLTEKVIQSTIESELDVITSQTVTITIEKPRMENEFTQADYVPQPEKRVMFGKKMQVDLRPNMEDAVAQTESSAIEAPVIEKPPAIAQPVYSAPLISNLDTMTMQTPKYIPEVSYVQSSAQEPKPNYQEDGCDPLPTPASDAFTQSEVMRQESSVPVIAQQVSLVQESAPPMKPKSHDVSCDPIPEVPKFGKQMQVTPLSLEVGQGQTFCQEVELAPVMPKRESNRDETTQSDPIVTYGKKMQVTPPAMEVHVCQTVSPTEPSPVISAVEAAPVVEKVCEPMLKTPKDDFSVQVDTPAAKPPSRSVRIQKGVGVFEGTRAMGTQFAAPEPRRSPLSPVLTRPIGIEWGVQVEPVKMSGVTQTPPLETPKLYAEPRPDMFSQSTQAELFVEPVKPIAGPEVFVSAPVPPRQPENLFSFVRETKAKVTGRRARSGSSGLIPYKTQVNQANNLSVSVPAMLNIKTDMASPATVTDGWGYSNRTTTSQVPRRYASRFRSIPKSGSYDRRNKSMENIYVRGSRTLPRHFISDSDLAMENRWLQQQFEMEQRCEECIAQCVRLIGFDKVAQMVMDTRLPGEVSPFDDLESYQARRRRLQNARTQYTSTTPLACPYCYDGGESHINGRPRWPSGAGEEEFFSGDDRYEWDTMRSYGSARRGTYKWITRTPTMDYMQTEPTSEEVDQLMKSRALCAYCSDYELQQSGINANFEENAAFTFVAWKTNHEGDEKLELDTIGRLLKLTMVGARIPGTGEVISAADAFYRGILRVIYMDDERGIILPLTTAINANAVIVEKRFSSGVGITFHSPRKCPIECTAVWQTPNMRRRTYRVNYIRVSDAERIPVSRALEEGIIDKYSGEIVRVRAPNSFEMGDTLLQMRESSVGTGETMERKQHPERFNIREAILNDIISVDLIQPEIILLPSSGVASVTPGGGRRDEDGSIGSEISSDLEV
ncbi:unnamed protein product [Hymenolepis diminuta]|uniref:SH3_10 domain-containing protein n=1 Tax=Hymenolepis diminuta TaxID=6216 RepID=A0A0R3SCG9_HYMDI|nr:unnamed protein product [Hymenolepis diminuta]